MASLRRVKCLLPVLREQHSHNCAPGRLHAVPESHWAVISSSPAPSRSIKPGPELPCGCQFHSTRSKKLTDPPLIVNNLSLHQPVIKRHISPSTAARLICISQFSCSFCVAPTIFFCLFLNLIIKNISPSPPEANLMAFSFTAVCSHTTSQTICPALVLLNTTQRLLSGRLSLPPTHTPFPPPSLLQDVP